MPRLQYAAGAGLDLRRVSRTYALRTASRNHRMSDAPVVAEGVELAGGVLTVQGRRVTHPRFERNAISWSQSGPDGFFSGVLHFLPDGLAFSGSTVAGATPDETHETTCIGAAPPTVFKTRVAREGSETDPPVPEGADGWEPGVDLTYGYTIESGNTFPTRVIQLAGEDANQYTALSIDHMNENVVVTVTYEPTIARLASRSHKNWPATASIEVAWDGESFTGYLCPYDSAAGAPSKLRHRWTGSDVSAAAIDLEAHAGGDGAPAVAVSALGQGQVPPDAPSELKIDDLVTQSPVGAATIANNMLAQNLQWAVPDDWRNNLFGVVKPDFSHDARRVQLIQQSLGWYQHEFGPAYLGWGVSNVSGAGAPSHPLSSDEKYTLQYYLHEGLAKSKDYNVQSQGIALSAFIQACPRLQLYIDDKQTDWAQQVFERITKPDFFTNTVNQLVASGTMEIPNRYSSILTALQPSGELAARYHQAIVTRCLTHIADQVDLTTKDSLEAWLPDVLRQFINSFITAPSNATQVQLELQAQAQALQQAADTIGGISELAKAMTEILVGASGGDLLEKASDAAERFAQKFPRAAAGGRAMLFMCWSGGLYAAVIGACNWDKLSTEQKVGLVTSIVEQFGRMVESVPSILDTAVWASDKAIRIMEDAFEYFSTIDSVAALEAACEACESNWLHSLFVNIKGMFNAAKNVIETEGTFFGAMFKALPVIMKFLGVAVAGLFAVLSIWQFYKDLKSGAPTLQAAFDGIIMATSLVVLTCAIIGLFVDLVVVSVLGPLAAVIGAVFAIVMLFLPKPKQVTPVDKFMDSTLRPFVRKLPKPPAGWAPPGTVPTAQAVLV